MYDDADSAVGILKYRKRNGTRRRWFIWRGRMELKQWLSTGMTPPPPPGNICQCLEIFFTMHLLGRGSGCSAAQPSSGLRLGMMLNILHFTGQLLTAKSYPVQNVIIVPRLTNPGSTDRLNGIEEQWDELSPGD